MKITSSYNISYTLITFVILLFSISTKAQLQVIADLGGESVIRFYEPIQPVHSEDAPHHPNAVPSHVSEEQMLPVISYKWKIGNVVPKEINLPGATPIFLVGADDFSMKWLEDKKQQLIAINATGLVINVENITQLNALRRIIPSIEFIPVSADSLADRLNISHYPLLITDKGISQ